MLTIDDAIEEYWEYMKRTGRPRSVAMSADTFQHLSRFKDAEGKYFVTTPGDHQYSYFLGVPMVIDNAATGVRFQDNSMDEWECEYCGIVWPTSLASVQCANCGGLRSR